MVIRRDKPFDGACYHIVFRGNNRNYILQTDEDKDHFKTLLLRYKKPDTFEIFHYCLMDNHVHLVIHLLNSGRLAKIMQGVAQSFTNHWKRSRDFVGCLWQGPYRRFLIENSSYLLECGRYIERNPVRAGMVTHPAEYAWSSYRMYAEGKMDKLVDHNPEYLAMGSEEKARQLLYQSYVEPVRPYENMLDAALAKNTLRKITPWRGFSSSSSQATSYHSACPGVGRSQGGKKLPGC